MSKGRRPWTWGFGPIGGFLYWPTPVYAPQARAAGWRDCAKWKICKDVPPAFVRGFRHSHRNPQEAI